MKPRNCFRRASATAADPKYCVTLRLFIDRQVAQLDEGRLYYLGKLADAALVLTR
ncbi:MAG TPA: hypothetical protein VHL99_05660 [Candidatus Binatia bacterium]|nr:hypothetical protein [Candidatus Binatia bacterium]